MNGVFVVYVNHPRNYTRIHLTSCRYYTHSHPKYPKNGKWNDEVKTLKDAEDSAKRERKKNNLRCSVCIK